MQIDYSRLPKVWPSKIEKGLGYRELADRYAAMDKQPLMVTAQLLTPSFGVELHLDGVLSGAVLASHPCTCSFPKGAAIVPLPLDLLWVRDGWPLWAAGDLAPVGDADKGREYWHKRYPSQRGDLDKKQNAKTTAGRWREYRQPVDTLSPCTLKAVCVGNQSEVERLLSHVSHIGKKPAAGYGRVIWSVDVMDVEQNQAAEMVERSRLLPFEYAAERGLSGRPVPARGWTPPYWYAPNWENCIEVAG